MKLARIKDGQVDWIGDASRIFGNAIPTKDDIDRNGLVECSFRAVNSLTEKSVESEPIFDGTTVWLDSVVPLSEDEVASAKAVALAQLRIARNTALSACDFTQLPDYPHDNAGDWAVYRQALRDLPQTVTDARLAVTWPIPPKP